MIETLSQLLVIDISAATVFLVNAIFGMAVLSKSLSRELKASTLIFSLSLSFFIVFYVLGINIENPVFAQELFSYSSVIIFSGVAFVHLLIVAFRIFKDLKKVAVLTFFYSTASALFAINIIFPSLFINSTEDFMFFPNYLLAGDYYFINNFYWLAFVITVPSLLLVAFMRARKEVDMITENKILYTLIAFVVFVGLGSLFQLNLYGVYVDPSIFLLFALSTIPLTYGTSSRKVSDVSAVLKRFGLFVFFSVSVALSFAGIFNINKWLDSFSPGFPQWLIPLMAAFCATAVIMYYWYTYMDTQVLKYEFISVITHKFRTPLTRIKWSVQMLENATSDEEKNIAAEEIADSAQNLVDLTDMLVDASKMEGSAYQYQFKVKNLNYIVEKVYRSVKERMDKKEIKYEYRYDDGLSKVYADEQRLEFALQILFENAISYTPRGGSVSVKICKKKSKVIFSISDTGIGITAKEQNYLFSKFYRSKRAKLADPNGMGIGVFMAKKIMERHNAMIWATSPGPNAGSTFWVSFPNAAHY
ncbi:MAG: sensor histidine kinase [Patescibacteria group bacterium]